jgi:hypothetical protein
VAANPPRDRDGQADQISPAELNDRLYRAYLAGDGPAVERIMTLIAAAEQRQDTAVGA